MISGFVALWMAAAVGQAAGEAPAAALLRAVPADAELVMVVRGFAPVLDDLEAMVRAMSPDLARILAPSLEGPRRALREAKEQGALAEGPALSIVRLPEPGGGGGEPPFALLVQAADYRTFQKVTAGRAEDARIEPQEGGYDVVTRPDGTPPRYTYKGEGFFAVSNSKDLIAAIARPKARLADALPEDLRDRLLGGDAGLYANLAALHARFADQINEGRKNLMALLDQAGRQAGNAEMMGAAKELYGGMFDALGDAQALALNLDFAAEGLAVAGEATVRPGSDTAGLLAGGESGTAALLARLPRGMAYYIDTHAGGALRRRMEGLGMSFLGRMGADAPEFKRALDAFRAAGPGESAASAAIGDGGFRSLKLAAYDDPKAAVAATTAQMNALKANRDAAGGFYKDVAIEPDAQDYRGFPLTRARITLDLEKFAAMQPNAPRADAMMKAIFGGDAMTVWYGTDGKLVLEVYAPDWDAARSLLDASFDGTRSIDQEPAFQRVRSKLPAQVRALFLLSAQGLARQFATQFSAMMPDNPRLKLPADLPEEPALLGGSVDTGPASVTFHAVVPSAVGPVVQKGLVPLFSGLAGQQP